MMKGSGTWNEARKMLNRLDDLERSFKINRRLDAAQVRRLKNLTNDVKSLLGTRFLADFEVAELLANLDSEPDQFARLRKILLAIQSGARRAPNTLDIKADGDGLKN